ncbi:long-chain fatty acid--CoA ligase [Thermaerobacter sp. PB12/4term]|nr:long-chain fatty acid--CoA ligase [Thermaerobacter sp. PB12/4term]QIA27652.1 long-chain fatty acid--CoA ligase [Thermaerobacter sp. PB12/4term]
MEERVWHRFYRPGARVSLDYPEVPLYRLLDQRAEQNPDLVALAFYHQQLTYAQLAAMTRRLAAALLARGFEPGERVLLMLPNCPAYVISYYGVLRAGGIAVGVNPLYVEREIAFVARDTGARWIVTAGEFYPRVQAVLDQTSLEHVVLVPLAALVEPGPEAVRFDQLLATAPGEEPGVAVNAHDVAVLQYTGGTTGTPKGAMLTHFNLVANVLQLAEMGDPTAPGETRILTILPLFHSYGMTTCMNLGIYHGSRLVLLPRFDIDQVMQAIKEHQITAFPGVPTMYVAVLNYPDAEAYGIQNIKTIGSGGSALPVEVADTFERKFGAKIGEGYGLSEASPVTHVNPNWAPGLQRRGSIGIPLPDTDARIVDAATGERVLGPGEEGELVIRGPQVMKGYWNRPEETRQALRDGWLYTGDIARMDEDGFFYIVDRKKDMIIVSGYNVYPREVEEVLYTHPAVLEAAVIGVPGPYKGEVPKAYVACKPGHQVTEEELIAYCRQHLAPYKVPRSVEFRAELPKTMVGKILRRALREAASPSPGREPGTAGGASATREAGP